LSADEIYEVTKLDKKMDSGQIRFILLKKVGDAVIDLTVTREDMFEAVKTVLL
jgi:3-dehydroquinate synthase